MNKESFRNFFGKKNNILTYLLPFGLLLFAVQHISVVRNIAIVDDQLGYWGVAAKLAGYDWSEMVSMTGYYGFGYPIILFPLFWLGEEPAVIYQLSIMLNLGMLIASFFLAVSCIRIVFPDINKTLQSIVCFLVTVYGNNMAQVYTAWTETLLYLLFWVVFYLLLLLDKRFTLSRMVLLVVICGYMYAVHQRSIGVCIAVVIVLGIKMLITFDRKRMLFFGGVVISLALLLLLGITIFKNMLVSTLWGCAEADVVSLTDYGGQIEKIRGLLNIKGLTQLFQSICGRIYYMIAGTMFSGAFGFVYAFVRTCSYIRKGGHCDVKKEEIKTQPGVFPFLFLVLSLLAEIGISAIFMYMDHSRIDILVYGRYMEFVFGPFMMLGFGFLISCKSLMIFAGISSVFLMCTIVVESQYEDMSNLSFNHSCASQLLQFFYNWKDWERENLFYCISLLIVCAMLLILIVLNKAKMSGIVVLIIICLGFWNGNLDAVKKINKSWNERFAESYEPVRELLKENNVMEITFLDSKTEVANTYVNADIYMKQLQFTLYDITMYREVIADVGNLTLEENQWYIIQRNIAEESEIKNLGVEVVLENECFVVMRS